MEKISATFLAEVEGLKRENEELKNIKKPKTDKIVLGKSEKLDLVVIFSSKIGYKIVSFLGYQDFYKLKLVNKRMYGFLSMDSVYVGILFSKLTNYYTGFIKEIEKQRGTYLVNWLKRL